MTEAAKVETSASCKLTMSESKKGRYSTIRWYQRRLKARTGKETKPWAENETTTTTTIGANMKTTNNERSPSARRVPCRGSFGQFASFDELELEDKAPDRGDQQYVAHGRDQPEIAGAVHVLVDQKWDGLDAPAAKQEERDEAAVRDHEHKDAAPWRRRRGSRGM